MSALALLAIGLAIMVAAMLALWSVQLRTRNAGPVDVAWSAGIGGLALLFAALAEGWPPRTWLVGLLAGLWALRLAWYLIRRIAGEPEDGRYAELRRYYGPRADWFFFWFFQFQAVLVLLFILPPLVVMQHVEPGWRGWDVLGVLIWLAAVLGEAIADRQLAAFRRQPQNRGKTCRAGLWRYSRHPNYFFEWVHWWAYCAMAIGVPWGWLTLLGPTLMLFFLFKLTGIPPTEARALASRGEDYRQYQRTTSVFIPWFPRAAP